MRSMRMCFSILQVPRCRINAIVNYWWEGSHGLNNKFSSSRFRVLSAKGNELEGRYSRRWVNSKAERSKASQKSKPTAFRHEILDETVLSSARPTLNVDKTKIHQFQDIQSLNIQERIVNDEDLAKLVTVIVFDIETTGLSRENERVIEIALKDLQGGENSTFQSLVNPGRYVPNSFVHGITTNMVCRPDVPRMEELIPILLQYIKSRQKPGGFALLVAHNARTFDVPFLAKEFSRCSLNIPSDWRFLDSLHLARESSKLEGSKLVSRTSLQALREKYNVPLVGSAHRAMSDVMTLSLVLQNLTFDLKLSLSGLIKRSFTASDLNSVKKKSSG